MHTVLKDVIDTSRFTTHLLLLPKKEKKKEERKENRNYQLCCVIHHNWDPDVKDDKRMGVGGKQL